MFCTRTKEFLRTNHVPFTDRDITADESAMAELEKLGVMTTPITVIDGQAVIGYDVPRFKTLLGL
jgi:glutaredoxin